MANVNKNKPTIENLLWLLGKFQTIQVQTPDLIAMCTSMKSRAMMFCVLTFKTSWSYYDVNILVLAKVIGCNDGEPLIASCVQPRNVHRLKDKLDVLLTIKFSKKIRFITFYEIT